MSGRRGAAAVAGLASLLACAAPEPPPATARIVGAGETLSLALRGAELEVPAAAATRLEATLAAAPAGTAEARLTLGGAGLGATEDALLDVAEADLRALVPEATLRRVPVRWWGRRGRAVVAEGAEERRERRVLLRSPWRLATLGVTGTTAGLDAGEDAALAFLGLRLGGPGWRLTSLRLAGAGVRLRLAERCEGRWCRPCGAWRLEGRPAPGESDEALRGLWRALRCRAEAPGRH